MNGHECVVFGMVGWLWSWRRVCLKVDAFTVTTTHTKHRVVVNLNSGGCLGWLGECWVQMRGCGEQLV